MLFISCHPNYLITGIIPEHTNYHPTNGVVTSIDPGVDAQFFHGGAPNWAIDQAILHEPFIQRWHGLPPEQPVRAMVSSYDTDDQAAQNGWDAERKERVEQFLLNYADYGSRYIRAIPEIEAMAEPWPNYNDTQWQQVGFVAKEIGIDFAYVLAYEIGHKNRPGLIARLEELIEQEPDPEPEDEESESAITVLA